MYLSKEEGVAAITEMTRLLWRSGLDTREQAHAIGVHERTFYKWKSGERRIPKMAMLALSNVALRQAIRMKKAKVKISGMSAKDIDAWLGFDA